MCVSQRIGFKPPQMFTAGDPSDQVMHHVGHKRAGDRALYVTFAP
jgi:hypothetical protein